MLDERRLTAFLCREESALGLKNLTGKLFASIRAFLTNLEVVENELIPLTDLDESFRGMAEKFRQLLEQWFRYRQHRGVREPLPGSPHLHDHGEPA